MAVGALSKAKGLNLSSLINTAPLILDSTKPHKPNAN